jgi:hypothetical protein
MGTNAMVKLLICRQRLQMLTRYQALLDEEEQEKQQADAEDNTIGWQVVSKSASLTPTTTSSSDDSFSAETVKESSVNSMRHLNHSPSSSDTDFPNLEEKIQYTEYADDLSTEDNFGQSFLTVWSIVPSKDCTDNATCVSIDEEVTLLTSTNVGNKVCDQEADQKDDNFAAQNNGAKGQRLCAQFRIAFELDEFTYPRNTPEVNSTGIDFTPPVNHEPAMSMKEESDLARTKKRNHDPSAKLAFPVDTKKKPRGRDPSIIQNSDDSNNNWADDAVTVSTDISSSIDAAYHPPQRRNFKRMCSRPDPPSVSIIDNGKILSSQASRNATSKSISEITVLHNYEDDNALIESLLIPQELIHPHEVSAISTHEPFLRFPPDAFLCPPSSGKNQHRGGIFTWFHRRRVTI